MPRIYTQTDGTSNVCDVNQYCAGFSLPGSGSGESVLEEGGTPGVNEITITHDGRADPSPLLFMQPDVEPGADIAAGDWITRMNVTTSQMFVDWDEIHICEVSGSGACSNISTIGSDTGLAIDLGNSGVKSQTTSGSATALAAGESFVCIFTFANSQVMSNSVGITPDADIDTPVNVAVDGVDFRQVMSTVGASVLAAMNLGIGRLLEAYGFRSTGEIFLPDGRIMPVPGGLLRRHLKAMNCLPCGCQQHPIRRKFISVAA